MGIGGSLLRVNLPGRDSNSSPSAKFKNKWIYTSNKLIYISNKWIYTSTPTYAFRL